MEEMREWRSNPTAPLNSVESHAHEIMTHNWNMGGQDILRLFPSVVGTPDGDQFLAIIKEAVASLLDMSVDAAHALIEEVYFHHSFYSPHLMLIKIHQILPTLLMHLTCIGIVMSMFLLNSGLVSSITLMLPTSVVNLLQSTLMSNIFTSE
jgi:hypothetical protein